MKSRHDNQNRRLTLAHLAVHFRDGTCFNQRMGDVNLGIWDKLTKVVIFLILLAIVLAVAIWYLPLIQQNERMRKEILRLTTQIQQNEETTRQLKASIDALRSDPQAVERLAREKFGYARPGETVIRFEEPVTNNVAHR